MNPRISIIIPVYNAFSYMNRCLTSLEGQTSKNFEAIFVDDCSTDDSYQNLQKELKKYSFSYQLLRNKKNAGPGTTRNHGIKHAKGEYITFLDSDDYINNDFIAEMESIVHEYPADGYVFDYFIVNAKEEKSQKSIYFSHEDGYINKNDVIALSNGMCWGKMYRRDVIIKNHILFPDLIRSEDLAFVKTFFSKCDTIYYGTQKYYYYVQNEKSIMHTSKTMDVQNNKKAFEYIKSNTEDNAAIEMIFIREYLYLIVQIMILQSKATKEIKYFIEEAEKMYPHWKNNVYLKHQPLYLRILLFFIRHKIIFPLRMIFSIKK